MEMVDFVELQSQLDSERADREKSEAKLSPTKAKFCSGRQTFQEVNTRRGYNFQPALSQTQKIKNQADGFGSHLRDFGK
jgi:hypothetical protein